jgi:hypothetical protein
VALHTLLDDLMPTYDVSSRHTIWVAARPLHVYAVARHLDLGRPRLVRFVMGIRVVPAMLMALLRGSRQAGVPTSGRSVGKVPFTLVAETPGEEFVLGVMGRFWTPTGGLVEVTPSRFRYPPPPELAQAIWNFRVGPCGAGTTLSTETRVRCGGPAARRQFTRYWRVIRLGSGLIRGSMLRQIRRAAERRAT